MNEIGLYTGLRNAIVNGGANVDDPGEGGTFSVGITGGAAVVSSGIRKLPVDLRNVQLYVYAAGAVTLQNSSGVTVAEITSGQVAHCISLGQGEWFVVGRDNKFPKVIDFSLYGTPDDDTYDNTPALESALADAYEAGGASIWFGSGREWWFLTALDSNNPLTYRHYENVSLLGISPEFTAQHQEASGVGIDLDNTYGTRWRFNLPAGATWWDVQRTYRFGPMRFENLSNQTETRINLFRFGDEGDVTDGAFRGLYMKACIFSSSPDDSIATDWLTNVGAAGYVLPEHRTYAIQMFRGYDVLIEDCTFRNFSGAGIRNVHGDRSLFRNCRSIICQLAEDTSQAGAAQQHVPSVYEGCYSESAPYYDLVSEGAMVSDFRGEHGYDLVFNPNIGDYALPAAVIWEIAAAADEIVFTGGFETGYDATNYFFPNMLVQAEADEDVGTFLPPRKFYITEVETDRIVFKNSASTSYVKTELNGLGTELTRLFDVNAVFSGENWSVNGYSLANNEDDGAQWAVVPSKKTCEIAGNATGVGAGQNADPTAYQPLIIASSAGNLSGGVKVGSRYNNPDHPLAFFDEGPDFHANWRAPIWDEAGERQIFLPGRGVGTADNNSRDLLFRKITDSEIGRDVWVYRLSDSSAGWVLRPIRKTNIAARYVIRCYASEAATISVYGGEGAVNTHSLSTGWHTITGTSHGTDAILSVGQMLADGQSTFIQLSGANVYVAKVTVTQ